MPVNYIPYIEEHLYPDTPAYRWSNFEDSPFTPLNKPVTASRIALISSCGFHLDQQKPFRSDKNDLSFREIPTGSKLGTGKLSHDNYNHERAEQDLNCVFPITRFREFEETGEIGELALALTFMGRIFKRTELQETMVPDLIRRLKEHRIDLAFFVPV